MGSRREDVDLDLVLNDPVCARKFIADFEWACSPPPQYVVYGIDQKIWFDRMTDEEAVAAAHMILNDVEKQMAWKTSQMQIWHH